MNNHYFSYLFLQGYGHTVQTLSYTHCTADWNKVFEKEEINNYTYFKSAADGNSYFISLSFYSRPFPTEESVEDEDIYNHLEDLIE